MLTLNSHRLRDKSFLASPVNRSETLSGFVRNGARGATMMEFALVLPLFFLLIFGFIDIARYWQARAAITEATTEGVYRLTVDPNLKKKGSTSTADQADYLQTVEAARTFVLARAQELTLQRDATITVGQPVIPATVEDFKNFPIEITTTATFNPILPFIWSNAIQFSSRVSAYVEPLKTTAEPIPTDCFGRLYDAFSPPGSAPYNVGCPCDKGVLAYTNSAGQCVCSSNGPPSVANGTTAQPDANCGCGTGMQPVVAYDWSYMAAAGWTPEAIQGANNAATICCPANQASGCPGNQYRPANFGSGQFSCSCGCGSAATVGSDGNCVCNNPNTQYTPGSGSNQGTSSCVCTLSTADCPAPASLNTNTCECSCPSGKEFDPNTKTCGCKLSDTASCQSTGGTVNTNTCACACPAGKQVSGSSCECDPANATTCSNSGGTMDPNTCTCGGCGQGVVQGNACACPNGGTLTNGTCDCGASKDWNSASSACQCKESEATGCTSSGGWLDPNTCACTCQGNKTFDSATNQCDCAPDSQEICETGTSWTVPGTFDASTCSCDGCPPQSEEWYGQCYCTGGTTIQDGACTCPSGTAWDGYYCSCDTNSPAAQACTSSGGTPNYYTCDCAYCPGGKVVIGGVCACADGTSWNGTNCACDANTAAALECTNSGGTVNSGTCACGSCPGGKVLSGNSCVCPSGQVWNGTSCGCDTSPGSAAAACAAGGGSVTAACGCACPGGGSWDSATNSCGCPAAAAASCTNSGGVYDGTASICSCDCGEGTLVGDSCSCAGGGTFSNGACSCPAGKVWNGTSCDCDPSSQSAQLCTNSGGYLDSNCACAGCSNYGQTVENGACECPAGKTLVWNYCDCDPQTASECQSAGGTMDSYSCTCECPTGSSLVNNVCQCQGIMEMSGGTCVCPSRYNGYVVTQTSATTCSTSCDPTYYHVVGQYCVLNTCRDNCPTYDGQTGGCPGCGGNG